MSSPVFRLEASARRAPDSTAIIHQDRRYSYRSLHRMAGQVAAGLAAEGFGPGSKIALCCSNRAGFLAAYFGALKIGATVVNLLWTSKARDFARLLNDSGAEALFCVDRFGGCEVTAEALEGMREAPGGRKLWVIPADLESESTVPGQPSIGDLMRGRHSEGPTHSFADDDTMLVVYTSGSTGRPKGIELSHGAVDRTLLMTIPLFEIDACRVRLVIFSMECIMSQLFLVLQPVFLGQAMVLLECENPATLIDESDPGLIWRVIKQHGVTFLLLMPSVYRWLLDHSEGVERGATPLRLCVAGGAPLPPAWAAEFEERIGVSLQPGYGASEVCAALAWTWPGEGYRQGCVGRPIPGVETRIVDSEFRDLPRGAKGHLLVRSPGLMKGYLNLPDVTATTIRDGWYCTRDMASFDEDGYLRIYGRMDNRITRGVEHIEPALVESLLLQHPAVAQAVVVPVPHETLGQEAKTFVSLRHGTSIAEGELLGWLKGELPLGQCPGLLEIRRSLPMTNTGKIARHLLT
jgi:long-chain acyl-CoA synthetase